MIAQLHFTPPVELGMGAARSAEGREMLVGDVFEWEKLEFVVNSRSWKGSKLTLECGCPFWVIDVEPYRAFFNGV